MPAIHNSWIMLFMCRTCCRVGKDSANMKIGTVGYLHRSWLMVSERPWWANMIQKASIPEACARYRTIPKRGSKGSNNQCFCRDQDDFVWKWNTGVSLNRFLCAAADLHHCTGAAQAFGDSPFEGETRWDMGFMGWSTCRILMDPIVFFPRKKMCFDVFRVPTVPGSKSARNAIADFIPNKQAPRIWKILNHESMFGSHGNPFCGNRYIVISYIYIYIYLYWYCLLQVASLASFWNFLMLFDLFDNRRLFGRWPWTVPRLCKSKWLFSMRSSYCAAIWSQAGYIHKLNQMLLEHDPAVCRPSSKLQSFARRCGGVQCCSTASVHTVHTLYVLPDPVAKLLLLPSSNSQALAFGQLPRQSERILWFGVEFYWVPTVKSYNVRPPLCSNTIFHHFSMILQHTWLHMITPYYNSLVTRF